jgi:PAS domain S-box-containing protein
MTDGPAGGSADATTTRPAFFETLVCGTSDAVVAFDADGEVVFANDAVASLLGRDPAELTGGSVDALFPAAYAGWLEDEVRSYADGGERSFDWDALEFPLRRADGSEVSASLALSAHQFDGWRFFSLVARDVDAHVERRESLAAELDRRERAVERFLDAVEEPLSTAEAALSAGDAGDGDPVAAVADAHGRVAAAVEEWLVEVGDDDPDPDPDPETRTVSLPDIAADAWSGEGSDALLRVDALGSVEVDPDAMRALLGELFAAARHHCDGVVVHVGPLSNGFYVATDRPGVPASLRAAVDASGDTPASSGRADPAGTAGADGRPAPLDDLPAVRTVAAAHGWGTTTVDREDGGVRFEFRVDG